MSKPEITATIKFRGVTIEGMTMQEMKELRDILNQFVGEKVVERVVERHDHHHYDHGRPWWYGGNWSISSAGGTLSLGNTSNYGGDSLSIDTQGLLSADNASHFTIALN